MRRKMETRLRFGLAATPLIDGLQCKTTRNTINKTLSILAVAAVALLLSSHAAHAGRKPQKPNILLMLADDLGFSDISCYGGEVSTPTLDHLAAEGLRYTQFYNTTRCWPSRAAILTGYYAQQVRRDRTPVGTRALVPGTRPSWAWLLPRYLSQAGYRSYHSGKWHLDGFPIQQGFDSSYFLADLDRYFTPHRVFIDDKRVPGPSGSSGYYATTAIADSAIDQLRKHHLQHGNSPFFEYVAFTAPHFPLQALPEDIAKYAHRFDAGWDVLRQQRLARMKAMGIVSCDLSDRTLGVPAWSTLSPPDQKMWSARMALHAAMIDRMDREIARILKELTKQGVLDNTLVLFLSDNGASAERIVRGDGNSKTAIAGAAESYLCLEAGWANLANTPLRLSKIYVHEGGISTPLIARWPAGISGKGEIRHAPGHLIDLLPTVLDLAGVSHRQIPATAAPPLPGKSLISTFGHDASIHRDYLWWYHQGNRALRVGDWKIVAEGTKSSWELYNISRDRSEMHNLASAQPDRVIAMDKIWRAHATEFETTAFSEAPPPVRNRSYRELRVPPVRRSTENPRPAYGK